MNLFRPFRLASALPIAFAFASTPTVLSAAEFTQINLVANTPGLAANTDPNLVNPWGVSSSATGPFWVSDQGTGLSTLYNQTGAPQSLVVTVPGGTPPNTGPTGQVFSGGAGFMVGTKSPAFIFDTLGGTINAWIPGTTTATVVSNIPGASYTGLALASNGGTNYLYAADNTGSIRVFNTSFAATTLAGSFTDSSLPPGYVPFNIQTVTQGGVTSLFVTYAYGSSSMGGIVDVFNTDGTFNRRFSSNSFLNAPWGVTLTPSGFGNYGNDILIGNFGNGEINAFDPTTGAFIGTLDGQNNLPFVNESLWYIGFRTAGPYDPNALYFTAGLANEEGGLLGKLVPTPEPSSLVLLGIGTVSLGVARLRRFFF